MLSELSTLLEECRKTQIEWALTLRSGDIINDVTSLFNVMVIDVKPITKDERVVDVEVRVYDPHLGQRRVLTWPTITKAATNAEIIETYVRAAEIRNYFRTTIDPILEAIKNDQPVCDENGFCLIAEISQHD